jgi:hypothetical protein
MDPRQVPSLQVRSTLRLFDQTSDSPPRESVRLGLLQLWLPPRVLGMRDSQAAFSRLGLLPPLRETFSQPRPRGSGSLARVRAKYREFDRSGRAVGITYSVHPAVEGWGARRTLRRTCRKPVRGRHPDQRLRRAESAALLRRIEVDTPPPFTSLAQGRCLGPPTRGRAAPPRRCRNVTCSPSTPSTPGLEEGEHTVRAKRLGVRIARQGATSSETTGP